MKFYKLHPLKNYNDIRNNPYAHSPLNDNRRSNSYLQSEIHPSNYKKTSKE